VTWKPALLALLLLAALPRLRAEPGLTGAQTLQRPFSARAVGMAESFVAVDGGLDSLGYNPAGLTRLSRPELQTTFTQGIANDDFGFLGYAHPLTGATVAGGLIYYNAGTIDLNLSDGTQGAVTAEQDFVGLMSVSVPLAAGLCAGGTAKFYSLTLAQQANAKGFAGDLGVIWHSPLKGLNFGAAIQDLGPDVKFEQTADPLPVTARFGAAYVFDLSETRYFQEGGYGLSRFLLTADAVKMRAQAVLLPATGLEMNMGLGKLGSCALRLGYMFEQDLANLTFGVGFQEGRWRLDYAYGFMRDGITPTNQISLGVGF